MMALSSARERLALLGCAFDAGIRHFDTAPYYGYGEAERTLGQFLKARRHEVTITTKFGIQPPVFVRTRHINSFARAVLKRIPSLRTAVARRATAMTARNVFTASAAQRSLENSLSALQCEYVDLLLLHEPSFEDANRPELLEFLQTELSRGRIRAFGCGGDYNTLEAIARADSKTSHYLQFEDNVLIRNIESLRPLASTCLTFGTFKVIGALSRWLDSTPHLRDEWTRRLGCDCSSSDTLTALLQTSSHARNPEGIVLFSSQRADRITSAALVAAGNCFSNEQLQTFDALTRGVSASLRNV